MAHHSENRGSQRDPLVLILADKCPEDRPRWQFRWAQSREDTRMLELDHWDEPNRNTWVNKLNLAIYRAGRPVVLVAHGLANVVVAWWAEYERPGYGDPVTSALLVGPPDLDRPGLDPRLSRFGSCPRKPLPFASFLVASGDRAETYSRRLARDWGSRYIDAGEGRLAGERPGEWSFGEALLRRLLGESRAAYRYAPAPVAASGVARPRGLGA